MSLTHTQLQQTVLKPETIIFSILQVGSVFV
jgi:hypothetical protein